MNRELYDTLFVSCCSNHSTEMLRDDATESGFTTVAGEAVEYFIYMDDPEAGRQTVVLAFPDGSRFAAATDASFADLDDAIGELEEHGIEGFEATSTAAFNTSAVIFLLSKVIGPVLENQHN